MNEQPLNFAEKFTQIVNHWEPRVLAEMNDYQFKLAKLRGDFVWHRHDDTDEAFIVIRGQLRIDLPESSVVLGEGEMYVVPKGVEHKPYAEEEVHLLLIEPKGVKNTGETGGDRTAKNDVWI